MNNKKKVGKYKNLENNNNKIQLKSKKSIFKPK